MDVAILRIMSLPAEDGYCASRRRSQMHIQLQLATGLMICHSEVMDDDLAMER